VQESVANSNKRYSHRGASSQGISVEIGSRQLYVVEDDRTCLGWLVMSKDELS
jgi:hypothetical protein